MFEEVPGSATVRTGLEDCVRLAGKLGLESIRSTDAGQALDDQDIEVFGAHQFRLVSIIIKGHQADLSVRSPHY